MFFSVGFSDKIWPGFLLLWPPCLSILFGFFHLHWIFIYIWISFVYIDKICMTYLYCHRPLLKIITILLFWYHFPPVFIFEKLHKWYRCIHRQTDSRYLNVYVHWTSRFSFSFSCSISLFSYFIHSRDFNYHLLFSDDSQICTTSYDLFPSPKSIWHLFLIFIYFPDTPI